MITITNWWAEGETSGSRKLANPKTFASPSGNDSKGYRQLMRKSADGLLAFGVFQALCQCMATLGMEARRGGNFVNGDGSLMEIEDLEDLTRIPTDILLTAINILEEIGWISRISHESADGIPSPPTDLPSPPHSLPVGEERRGGEKEGIGEGGDKPPPKPIFEPNENVRDAKAIIDGINPDWRKAGGWSPTEERSLMESMNYVLTLPLDTIEALKTYRATATDTFHQKYFLNRNLFIRKMSELAQASLAQKPKPKRNGRGGGPSKIEDFLIPEKK